MAPLPGLPKKSRSDDDLNVQKSENHSPSKKTRKEPEEEELDYGEGPDERSESVEFEARTRKRVPITLRLGNIDQMAAADTARFYKRLDNLDQKSSPGNSSAASVTSNSSRSYFEPELDQQILDRRQKQIDYGKATPEYTTYCETVPRISREPHHPKTPNMARKYSRRAWDGLIRQWRLQLHYWNKSSAEIEEENRKRAGMNDSFCSEASFTTGSTSTASSTMGDEEGDKTVVKAERSWYEEVEEDTLEFEEALSATNLNKTLEQTTDDDEETVRVRV